ncbi:Dephospho-CoA kinase [[Clostridium] ultunense Esp]|uniref:Dephospho-CoA kinase n=1 Tax=[Clostridium] ultunense Esp TaxID=1288971 RepID=M1ZIE5_9FIRM|nr:dephospho-CoA kinase [Schnuerera ultunensis]CCQ98374.1 Dephospho-CoA kinase [[Clostridium] ultunense Esp]SHD77964.1 dephosphocoenzyme A kinase [[Clostridium] ultunense Esp]
MNQNKARIIGLTGGIATGKSTVSNIIKNLGYKVIDADKIAKNVVQIGKPAYKEIIDVFGKSILDAKNNINRKKLGSIIFKDRFMRMKLNNIVHPYVFEDIKELIDKYKEESIIFLDVPLLIEEMDEFINYGISFDEIWLVYVDETTQLDRLIKRDLISKEDAIKRIKAQMPIKLKREYATRIIDNGKDLKSLEETVEKIVFEVI